MTQFFRISDDGELAVWWHGQDPSTDAPIATTAEWSKVWPDGGAPDRAETLLLDWLKQQALPNDIGYQDSIRIIIDTRADDWEQV